MQNKIIKILLGAIFIVLIIWNFSSCQRLKKAELDFSNKKASLIKDNLDLKDKLVSLEQTLKQKAAELALLEEDTKSLKDALAKFKLDNENLRSEYNRINSDYADAKKKNEILQEEVAALKEQYLSLSRKAAAQEEDRPGKPVSLAPILVSGKEKSQQLAAAAENKIGRVSSLEKKSNLAIIDLGRRDGVKLNDACEIFKDNKRIASGEVINVRYNVAAVFINELEYEKTFSDIEKGDKVLIAKEN